MKGGFFIKKILIITAIFVMIACYGKYTDDENVEIPLSSIRFRVVSNSNDSADMQKKLELKTLLEDYLYKKIEKAENVNDAEKIVVNELDQLKKITKEYLNSNNFDINYGLNYFPSKVYKGVVYDRGYYNSLVVTIGTGGGSNWWCVLFPPLCLVQDNETTSDVEYKFFINRIIEKFK